MIIIATIFSFALLFPIAIQSAHAFDIHEHQECNDITTHFHKKQFDCSICDFHFQSFDFKPFQFPEFVAPTEQLELAKCYQRSEIFAGIHLFYLRGPPLFS